jgi:hypothetical protein
MPQQYACPRRSSSNPHIRSWVVGRPAAWLAERARRPPAAWHIRVSTAEGAGQGSDTRYPMRLAPSISWPLGVGLDLERIDSSQAARIAPWLLLSMTCRAMAMMVRA